MDNDSPTVLVRQPPENSFANAWMGDTYGAQPTYEFQGAAARQKFREFFRNFRLGAVYIYRESLLRHWNQHEFFIEVDCGHLNEYDEVLFNNLQVC